LGGGKKNPQQVESGSGVRCLGFFFLIKGFVFLKSSGGGGGGGGGGEEI